MLEQLTFDQNGVKTVCEMGSFHPEMRMTIRVKRFTPGEAYSVFSETCETAFLILYGRASVTWNGETREMQIAVLPPRSARRSRHDRGDGSDRDPLRADR